MAGTIIITGANSSLAIPAIQHLLKNFPDHTAVLTVRNASDLDLNTKKLQTTLAQHPNAKTSIRALDLANLSAVHEFATTIAAEVAGQKLPLDSIVCNAYYWNLLGGAEVTDDGYGKTFQVTHIAHTALVLRLLGSFGSKGGRVVLLSSDAHWPGKNSLEKYPPAMPSDLELLVKRPTDEPIDNLGRGFQRYAVSKLAVVTWMYGLNRYLEKDPKLHNVTAVAINPGNLSDSRALRINTPRMLVFMSKYIIQPLRPLLRLMDPTMRTAAEGAIDVIDLAMRKAHPQDRGYFTLLTKDVSAPESMDEERQQMMWVKSLQWARITRENTALTVAWQ